MKKHTQVYDEQQELKTDIEIDIPDLWSLLNKDVMANALALSLVLLTVSLCYSTFRQSTTSKVSDNPVQVKVGAYDKP